MALYSGFFDSISSDRLYSAEDFSRYLAGLVTDGCLPNDTGLKVIANTSGQDVPSVKISVGKAYSNGLWFYNDAEYIYLLGEEQQTPYLFHHIYLCFDTNEAVRAVSIEHVTNAFENYWTPKFCPDDADGKFYLPLATATDDLTFNPVTIRDNRLLAGVTPSIELGSIDGELLAPDAVDRYKILDGEVINSKLGPDAVNNAKLADNAVQTENIKDGAVTEDKLSGSIFNGILPQVYMSSAQAVESLEELGGSSKRLNYTAVQDGRMKIDTVIVVDGSTIADETNLDILLEYSQQVSGVWTGFDYNISTVKQGLHGVNSHGSSGQQWVTISTSGVFDIVKGRKYSVRVRAGGTAESVTVDTMKMYGVVGPRLSFSS